MHNFDSLIYYIRKNLELFYVNDVVLTIFN